MAKTKFTFDDIKIGDKVLTTSNEIGIVIAIKSYAYLNDKLLRKADGANKMLIDLMPFQNDNVKHKDVWYSTLTIAVLDNRVATKLVYYLEGIDFIEIKEIIRNGDTERSQEKQSIWTKIKKFFNI